MIPRTATATLERLAKGFPVIVISGPRQSGKTTLARSVFSHKTYVSLENPDERAFAQEDPKRFLQRFSDGAVLDEVQRCPDLLSWLQGLVDKRGIMCDFVLTGSAQFDLMAGIAQSLAGRAARVELLPLSATELAATQQDPADLNTALFQGGYPALYDRDVSPQDWFANYINTYLERDVRQLVSVRDLSQFQTFVKMCAARSGQLLNLSSLGADCGVSSVTAKHWLSVLEASYIVTLLHPHHRNFGKRLVKAPKLYFCDVGLAAWLLGIRDAATLDTHAARGALFETYVVSELMKQCLNAGKPSDLYFWRDSAGNEVDVVIETAQGLQAIEIKSGSTFASDWSSGLKKWQKIAGEERLQSSLVYGGELSYEREGIQVCGWQDVGKINMPIDQLTHADLSELVNRDDDERAYQFIRSR
jgi:predicted AAA+ superfamily ATPase